MEKYKSRFNEVLSDEDMDRLSYPKKGTYKDMVYSRDQLTLGKSNINNDFKIGDFVKAFDSYYKVLTSKPDGTYFLMPLFSGKYNSLNLNNSVKPQDMVKLTDEKEIDKILIELKNNLVDIKHIEKIIKDLSKYKNTI